MNEKTMDLCPKPPVFVREATGLVREFSAFELASINFANVSLYAIMVTFFSYSYLFPNTNLGLVLLLTVIGVLPLGISYAMGVVAMPRSGGDYVFVSRTLHPTLGLMLTFTYVVCFYSGAFVNWIFTLGLAPALSVIGAITNSQSIINLSTTLSAPSIIIVAGTVCLILGCIAAILRARWVSALVTAFMSITLLSLAAIMVVFFSTSPQAFQNAFNAYSLKYTSDPNYYNTIIQEAQQNGFSMGTFSWSDTISMIPFGAYIFLYISIFGAVGGEVKHPGKTSYYATIITIVVTGSLAILTGLGFSNALTPVFYNSVSFVYYSGLKYVLPLPPYYYVFASLMTNNVAVAWLLNIGAITNSIGLVLMGYLVVPRYLLAASFDRLLPEKVAAVSDRFHTPYVATVIIMVFSLITLPIYTFLASLLATLSSFLGEVIFAMLIFAIATILFPFSKRTKAVYEASPIKKSLAGIPVITIVGILNTAVQAFVGYMLITNSAYGVNSPASLIAAVLVAAAAPIWFYVRKAQMRKNGLDLDLVFREIPPE